MKKFFKIFLCAILLCPLIGLAACTSPAQFQIKANPSDRTLGSIPIASEINLNKKNEGTKITLAAKENYPNTNPFVCWIKDYKEVVSTEKNLNLTYNEQTEGEYTALFHETKLSSMAYASLNTLNFETEQNYTSIKYNAYYLPTTLTDYFPFSQGTIKPNEEFETNNYSVLYFGNTDEKEYRIKFDLEIINQNETIKVSITFDDIIARNSFDENGNYLISKKCVEFGQELGTFQINFAKLNKNMF